MRTTKAWREEQREALREGGWANGAGADGPDVVDVDFGDQARAMYALLDDADALTTIALAAGLGADATAEEVAQRVGGMVRTLSLLGTWRAEHGAALKPSKADTYGDGMRDAKRQVGAILSRLAEEAGRG